MFNTLRKDIHVIKERDPAVKNTLEVLLCYSGLHAIWAYRLAHFFYLHKWFVTARIISTIARFFTGIEIHPGAQIGEGLFIDHGMGVVIGETTEIGDNCTLYQGVTLGGTGKDKGKRHPTLGNNVLVGSGAKVLGPVKIGDNARVAAGAVVLSDVPPNATAVGVPARVVRINGVRPNNLDQIHVTDPVAQELCRMNGMLYNMQKALGIRHAQEATEYETEQDQKIQSQNHQEESRK